MTVLNVNYNIMDNIVLTYNLGKSYGFGNVHGGNMISSLSVHLGLGSVTKQELYKKAIEAAFNKTD